MKQKIAILGILLIAGLLVMGPVSATNVIGHGSKTINEGHGYYAAYKWTTYEYSTSHVQMVLTGNLYNKNGTKSNLARVTEVTDIVKAGNNRVKVVQSMRSSDDPKTYKSWDYWNVKRGNAVRFYNTETFKSLYLKANLV
jgi:hypothetical protein